MPGTMTNDTIEYIVISFGSRRRLLAKPPTFELLMKRSCGIFDFTADTRLCAYFMYRNRCGELVEMELDPSAYSFMMTGDELEWKALDSPARASFQDGHHRTGPVYLGAEHERVAEDGSGHKLSKEEHIDDSPRSCSTLQDEEVGNDGVFWDNVACCDCEACWGNEIRWDNAVVNSKSRHSYDNSHDREATPTPTGRPTTLLELIDGMTERADSPTPQPDSDATGDDGWPANDPRTFIDPGCWPGFSLAGPLSRRSDRPSAPLTPRNQMTEELSPYVGPATAAIMKTLKAIIENVNAEDNEAVSLDSNDQNPETSHLREVANTPIAAPTTLSVATATIKGARVFSPRPGEKATTGHQWLHPIPSGPLRARRTGERWAPDSGTPTRGRRHKHITSHYGW